MEDKLKCIVSIIKLLLIRTYQSILYGLLIQMMNTIWRQRHVELLLFHKEDKENLLLELSLVERISARKPNIQGVLLSI